MASPVGPVIYAIYVNGLLTREFPIDVELRQSWGCHDLFLIRIEYPRTNLDFVSSKLWDDNTPVKIVWGRRPDNIQTWYGYVNHHVFNSNASDGTRAIQITYVLVGTSKPMNSDKTATWGDVTPTYIAKKIAASYGFRAVLSSTNWIIPYEVQSNESDFKFLDRLADKTGFRFWVSGGTLYFIDPAVVLFGAQDQAVPRYRLDKLFTQLDSVRDFEMHEGGAVPGMTVATRTIYGIDDSTGTPFQVNADAPTTSPGMPNPGLNYIMRDWPADNINDAKNLVNAWQARNQFWQTAKAELYGSTYIYPGKLVYLSGAQMPPHASGYWIVACATHLLKASGTTLTTSDKYVTQVRLLKNTTLLTPNIKASVKITPEFTSCILNNSNQWVSSSAPVIYDGVLSVPH